MVELIGDIYSGTHFIIINLSIVLCVFAVVGAFCLFFAPLSFFSAEKCIAIGAILLICLSIFGIVALLKWLSVFIHKKCEAKKSTQMKNDVLIGLGGIVICGIIPRFLVFFAKIDGEFIYYSIFLPFVISIALYCIFVYEGDKKYESLVGMSDYFKLLGWHVVVLFVIVKIALICDFDERKREEIIFWQVLLMFFCAPNTMDLCTVLSGLRKLKGVDEGEEPARNGVYARLESVEVARKCEKVPRLEFETSKKQESQAAQTHPKINCKNCHLEYSEVLIPRFLNGCGHTICEECTESLLNKNEGKFLFCPFCDKVTAVNGPASMLQKNYGILEIIKDLKN